MDTRWFSVPHSFRRALFGGALRGERYRRDAYALQQLAPLSVPWLPWTEGAVQPSALLAILNDVVFNDRSKIVELGSGISTIYIARLLLQRGSGHLYSVEEDQEWATKFVQPQIEKEGLDEYVSLIVAPLEPSELAADGTSWYATGVLGPLREAEIDMLIVDGPIATRHPAIRYPALPFFFDALAGDALIALDDIGRRGEAEIVLRWEDQFPISFDVRPLSGVALAHGRGD